ncbi:MAG: NUDIX hydrolase [Euryarchaeota archaeon TMED192]|nr:MAG: NUDIX hydrolase [Euryarchaeota archaeon TMED192]|tara:strand:- start:3776 stop:4255 length:480 start_codon:yes stop_codon:yes gene_type:complete
MFLEDADMARRGCDVCGADGYSSPSVTVDAVATRVRNGAIEALMIQRGANPPEWKGKWAFPGGFVDVGEDPLDAVLRELREETGVYGRNPTLLSVLGSPGRDPRKHCVGLFYRVDVDGDSKPSAGDDAVNADWVPLGMMDAENVAGDHIQVIGMISNAE